MAEHLPSGPADLGAPMDYAEHERTYAGFVQMTTVGVFAGVITLIALAIFSFGGGAGFWAGTLLLLLMLAAVAISIAAKGTTKPLIAVTVLSVLLMVLTVA